MAHLLPYLPLLLILVLAALIDTRERRIPNWLTFGLIVAGVIRSAAFARDIGPAHSILGIFGAAAIPFVLFALGALGGGDVKLMAGIGAWLGTRSGINIFVVECVVGFALVLIQALASGRAIRLFQNSAVLACNMMNQGVAASAKDAKSFQSVARPLPYAVPVAIATVIVLCSPLSGSLI